jgi:hypothetical protein
LCRLHNFLKATCKKIIEFIVGDHQAMNTKNKDSKCSQNNKAIIKNPSIKNRNYYICNALHYVISTKN